MHLENNSPNWQLVINIPGTDNRMFIELTGHFLEQKKRSNTPNAYENHSCSSKTNTMFGKLD